MKYLIAFTLGMFVGVVASSFTPAVKYGKEVIDCVNDGATYMAADQARNCVYPPRVIQRED